MTQMKVFVLALAVLTATAASTQAAPDPGSIGIRVFDSSGNIVGGLPVRVMKLSGNWPQPTLYVTSKSPGVTWVSVMTNTYEVVVLDGTGEPIVESAKIIFVPAGAHDLLLPLLLPETCPGDVDYDGVVGVSDLVAVIAAWGWCPGCAADLDHSNTVDLQDLIEVILAWGDCVG